MTGDCHVQFYERLKGKFLRPTHLKKGVYVHTRPGFFAPGLKDEVLIKKLCQLSPVPVNIMITSPGLTPKTLAKLGVSRISYGPIPYCQSMEKFKDIAKKAVSLSGGI